MIMKIDLVFVWVVQITFISVWRSNLTCFQCRDEVDLVVVWVVEIDVVLNAGRKSLAFSVGIKVDLNFCGWSKLT